LATRLPRQIDRQTRNVAAKSPRNLAERQEREIAFATFHAADIAPVNFALKCQVFLRPTKLLPCGANALAKGAKWHVFLHGDV
jgi:hypothetical protein